MLCSDVPDLARSLMLTTCQILSAFGLGDTTRPCPCFPVQMPCI